MSDVKKATRDIAGIWKCEALEGGLPICQHFGAYSEVGKLRKVLVCRPGLAHLRLTPENASTLLFDDVIWVQEAQNQHHEFTQLMRNRGIEVLEFHDLLATTLEDVEARAWLLNRKITPDTVPLIGIEALRRLARTRCPRRNWPSA